MRHIKDIYSIEKEVHERIVRTMQERGLTEITFCPDEETYWKEHENDEDAMEYCDYRYEHAPYIVYFDKHGNGTEYCVMKVELCGTDYPHFKMECDNDYDSVTFCDDEVESMLPVYEMLEEVLEIDEEQKETWVLIEESVYDYALIGRSVTLFKNEKEARKMFRKAAKKSRETAKKNGWTASDDDCDFFEAYPEERWGSNHETVELMKSVYNEKIWCRI